MTSFLTSDVEADAVSAPPLLRMTQTTPTVLWNDSADPVELAAAIGWGAVGATCNPVLALSALKAHRDRWRDRVCTLAAERPSDSESDIGWQLVRELSVESAALLEPIYLEHEGRNGRLSVQTDPRLHRDEQGLVAQAVEFDSLAANIIVKIPATEVGVRAMEEATYRGVSINATVSFTVAQVVAVAEAVERGLARREAEGLDTSRMGPVATIMVGRLDDWLKHVTEGEQVTTDPGVLDWAGVACFKRAHEIFLERGYRTRLLSAAFRNHLHWSELVGGDVVISPPYPWQVRLNASGIDPLPRLEQPIPSAILASLCRLPEFRKAYDENGMSHSEFASFGPTLRTLRQFLAANADLEKFVRDVIVPDPD